MESGELQKKGVNEISATQLHQMLKKKDFTLINVHIPYAGEIPNTDMFIPYDEIIGHLNELADKNQKIVLYCRSDHMSTIAAETLTQKGYSNLYNLKGGMNAWRAAGYRLLEKRSSKYKSDNL
jgi:rhodanese-related sulfurtransferase